MDYERLSVVKMWKNSVIDLSSVRIIKAIEGIAKIAIMLISCVHHNTSCLIYITDCQFSPAGSVSYQLFQTSIRCSVVTALIIHPLFVSNTIYPYCWMPPWLGYQAVVKNPIKTQDMFYSLKLGKPR